MSPQWMRGMIVVVCGIVLAGVMWYVMHSDNMVRNTPLRGTGPIIFFGDSLVAGVGASPGHDLPSLLALALAAPVLNYGVPGDTTQQGLDRVPLALGEHPRLTLILLGGNDFLQKVPREESFANLKKIITLFQADGSVVVLIGVRSGIIGGGADDKYQALARETQSAYIEDVLQGVIGDPTLMSDAVHPNDAGYQYISERIFSVITPLLQKQ